MKAFILFLVVLGACATRDEYQEAITKLDSVDPVARKAGLDTIYERFLRERRLIERKLFVNDRYGAGPLPQRPGEEGLARKLSALLSDENSLVSGKAAALLLALRPPGYDERILQCAINGREWDDCIDVVLEVADATMLDTYAAYMDLPSPDLPLTNKPRQGSWVTLHLVHLGKRAVPYLAKYVAGGSNEGCINALYALKKFLEPETEVPDPIAPKLLADQELKPLAVAAARPGLEHSYWQCRRLAARLVGKHDPNGHAMVEPLRNDPSELVREVVAPLLEGREPEDYFPNAVDDKTGNYIISHEEPRAIDRIREKKKPQ